MQKNSQNSSDAAMIKDISMVWVGLTDSENNVICAYNSEEIIPVTAQYEASLQETWSVPDQKPRLINQAGGDVGLIIRNAGKCLAESQIAFCLDKEEEQLVVPTLDLIPFGVLFHKQFMEAKVASEMAMNQERPLDLTDVNQIKEAAQSFSDAFSRSKTGKTQEESKVVTGFPALQEKLSTHIEASDDFFQGLWDKMILFYTPAFSYLGMQAVLEERQVAEQLLQSMDRNDIH